MAIVTSLAVGVAASAAAGAMKAKAEKKAANAKNAADWERYTDSRGANGSALLPLYADDGTEKRLFDRAVAASDAIGGGMTPQERWASAKALLDTFQPAIEAGNREINSIYDGSRLDETLGYVQPVLDARTAGAVANRDAVNLAYQRIANAIAAEEAAKGYGGAGSFSTNRLLDATIEARQQAAGGVARARFENAAQRAGLELDAQNLRLGSINLAPTRAAQILELSTLPDRVVAENASLSQQPLQFFKMPVGNPPMSVAVPQTGTGQILLQSLAQGAGSYGSYEANKRAAANMPTV